MNFGDEGIFTANGARQSVAKFRVGEELTILKAWWAVKLEAFEATDVTSCAREDQNWVIYVTASQARDILQICLDEVEWCSVVWFSTWWMFGTFEVKLCKWQIVVLIGNTSDFETFAMSVNSFGFEDVVPTTWISVNSESSASANIATNPKLPPTETFALRAMNEEMSFASLDIDWLNVVTFLLVQLKIH